ncbi:DNA topoisomerase IV, alpha subunit, partial [Coniophora puteana RWD-64-598 SS2]
AQVLGVLNLVHEAISGGYTTTKRDIYYKDVELFKSQATVDRIVDDVAATFEAERSMMNVRATSKGLLLGNGLEIHLTSKDVICSNVSEGILIPPGEAIERFDITEVPSWILIVEKEVTKLSHCGQVIGLQGKGYPDVATRELLKTFGDNLPDSVPILALVDGDPHGLDILSVYKFGSASMKHEVDKLAANRIESVGIWGSELSDLGVGLSQLIPITKQDEAKEIMGYLQALAMLQRPDSLMPSKWRSELARMLHLRRKAEIEVLTSQTEGISGRSDVSLLLQYLRRKIVYFVDLYTSL